MCIAYGKTGGLGMGRDVVGVRGDAGGVCVGNSVADKEPRQ